MLDKIKNFVKSVSPTTWIVVAIGVVALVVLWNTWAPPAPVEAVPAPVAK
jgi:hypothetical protein